MVMGTTALHIGFGFLATGVGAGPLMVGKGLGSRGTGITGDAQNDHERLDSEAKS